MNIGTMLIIAASSLAVTGIGAYISFAVGRRHNTNEDWIVGGRSLPIYVVAFTQYATAVGGWSTIMASIPQHLTDFPGALTAAGPETILLWFFTILPGTLTNQLYYQRIFAACNVREARTGIYLSCLMILIAGTYAFIMGLSILAMNPSFGVESREEAAGWFLTGIPVWLLALYGAFLMATIVSTTGSALQSVVVNLVSDLRRTFTSGEDSEADLVRISRWTTIIVTAVAAALALIYPEALGWLIVTYAYSAAILAVPLLVGMMLATRYRVAPVVAYASMLTGLVCCASAHIIGTTIPYAVFGMLGSLIAYLIALGIRRPEPIGADEPDPTLLEPDAPEATDATA